MGKEDKLIKAALKGDVKKMEKLLDEGIDVNSRDAEGASALYMAAAAGQAQAVALLLDRGAAVDLPDLVLSSTPLHRASEHADTAASRLLLDRGADVNARAAEGWGPLHVAARANQVPSAQLLIERGADVNMRTNQGDTPLRYAVFYGNQQVADYLRANGGVE